MPVASCFGITYGEAADQYPDGAYTNETLEIDGISFPSPHPLAVYTQASPDGSAPIPNVSVGDVPVCD
ncbi:MAG: hypothetical protein ACRDWS_03235 [Acidimicrobiia bacterium]